MKIFVFKLVLIVTLFFLGFVGLIVNIMYVFTEAFDMVILKLYTKIEDKVDSL
jgi:hypothetical protein